jgi:hypothetical protein
LHIGRQDETVLRWVHLYNRHGPTALAYRHTGGRSPLLLIRWTHLVALVDRLWPKFELDPEFEAKLLVPS